MPNDNLLTDERVAAAKNIVAAWVQSRKTFIDGEAYGAAVELVAFALARNPGQPEPRAEVTGVQWWLAELDQHGNPKLSDGAHSERAGADKAMYLIKNLGLDNKGKRWAVARVELSEPRPSADGVNHDAVSACRAMVDAARTGASS